MSSKLFSKKQIMVSSVFGTVFVSLTLMLINLYRIKKKFELKYLIIGFTPFVYSAVFIYLETNFQISRLVHTHIKDLILIINNLIITLIYYKIFVNSKSIKPAVEKNEKWYKVVIAILLFYIFFFGITTSLIYYNLHRSKERNIKQNELNIDVLESMNLDLNN